MRGRLNGAGAKAAGGVTVDQQSQHHRGRILLAAGTAMIDAEVAGGNLFHRIEDEVNDMTSGHPVAQIARQEHRRLAVEIDETCGHGYPIPAALVLFKIVSK